MTTTHCPVDREEIARHRILVRDHPHSTSHLQEAVQYFIAAGLPHESCGPLKKLIELEPEEVSLRLLLGAVCVELGDIEGAEEAFIESTLLAPHSTAGYHNLGVLYCATGQAEKAEEKFNAILALEPDNHETLNDLAVLYASTERPDQAQATYERCLTCAPEYEKCRDNALHFALSSGRHAVGRAWVTRLLENNPDDPGLLEWRKTFAEARQQTSVHGAEQNQPRRGGHRTAEDLVAPPEKDKVSVIIPAYNAAELLPATIDHLLAQTYSPMEIIVVDDGSLDVTAAVVEAFGNRVTRIGRVHQGWAAAANEGIQQSRGQWIVLANPGDLLHPEALKKQVRFLKAHPQCDTVYTADARGTTNNETPATASGSGSEDGRVVLPLFRREAFARLGFFDETAGDDYGTWAGRMMAASVERFGAAGEIQDVVYIGRAARREATDDDEYRAAVERRWLAECDRPGDSPVTGRAPAVGVETRTGLKILFIGADDPGGMFASLAAAVNRLTPHRCRVLVHQSRVPGDPQVVLPLPQIQADPDQFEPRLQELVQQADWLIFAAGLGPGAARRDCRLEDTEERPFGSLDWRTFTSQKKCAAFLCSSPSVRGNYQWYYRRFADRGWPVMTASPDIYRHVPHAHFVPPVIDLSAPEYTRTAFSVGPVAVTFHERPPYAGGQHGVFVPIVRQLKTKHGDQILFSRCAEMTRKETLLFRQRVHIGFDRLSFGAPRFGLTSLENSALGLVNIVYLDEFSRALLARTLGTDQLPWLSPDSPYVLYEMLDELITNQNTVLKRMQETAAWFHRYWTPETMVRRLAKILTE